MKRIFLLICVLLIVQLGQAVSQTVTCESIEDQGWGYSIGIARTCFMQSTTTVDTDAVSVSPPDSTVLGLDFWKNKKISFLPMKLDETYPHLVAYDASYCSVKTVSKINFKNLNELKLLLLHSNRIEIIKSDTFEDLTSLEYLQLSYNKIKRMNAAVFGKLNQLTKVYLSGNVCIDKSYYNPTLIANSLVKDVNENCAFVEPESNESSPMKTLAHWKIIFTMICMRLLA